MIDTVSLHISDQVVDTLLIDGWTYSSNAISVTQAFTKRIEGFATAGTVSNGARVVCLQMDETGRWLERVDQGLGRVVRDVDLRDYWGNPKGAIAAVLA